jgi:hypothetical protein
MTGVSHPKKAEYRLKTCEDYTSCRERYGQRFGGGGDSQGILFIYVLTEQRTVKVAY